MFIETIKSEGLAHLSYLVGDESAGEAAVIDPRRDCQIYLDRARELGVRIRTIFETHRNEDYVIGSRDLARFTGAEIRHGEALDFHYGQPVSEGDTFDYGDVRLGILETPGHTFESISITLADTSFSEDPVAVFTGDALFVGDVGRTDFFPDRAEEVAGLLYDSVFGKLLPLGDHVLIYPAHGAGSVCGKGMASREFSSIGYERKYSPVLQLRGRDEFIRHKTSEQHEQPPYFRKMEEHNQMGNAAPLDRLPQPTPMSVSQFAQARDEDMIVIDTRSPEAFGGAFIPGSICLPLAMIPAYAGWLLPYGRPLGLVVETPDDVQAAVRYFVRLGYDQVRGFLVGGLSAWETSGRPFDSVPTVTAEEISRRIRDNEEFILLDVRKPGEVQEKRVRNSKHIFLGDLPDRANSLPRETRITTFCGSGKRAMIAASILKAKGFHEVEDNLGSMEACAAVGCPMDAPGETAGTEAAARQDASRRR